MPARGFTPQADGRKPERNTTKLQPAVSTLDRRRRSVQAFEALTVSNDIALDSAIDVPVKVSSTVHCFL
jgi:hypothetical protein